MFTWSKKTSSQLHNKVKNRAVAVVKVYSQEMQKSKNQSVYTKVQIG